MPVLAVVRLEPDQPLVVLDLKHLPPPGRACVFAHLDENLVLVVEDHLGDRELPVLGIENDDHFGDVGVLRDEVVLVELVGALALGLRAVGKSHAEAVDVVLEPLELGHSQLVDLKRGQGGQGVVGWENDFALNWELVRGADKLSAFSD